MILLLTFSIDESFVSSKWVIKKCFFNVFSITKNSRKYSTNDVDSCAWGVWTLLHQLCAVHLRNVSLSFSNDVNVNTFSRIRSGVRRRISDVLVEGCSRKKSMILNRSLRKSNLLLKGWLLSISFFSFVMICGSRNHPKEDGSKKQTYVDSKINSQKIASRTLFLKGHDVHGAYCPSFVTRQTLERSAPILHEAVQVRVLSGWEVYNRVSSLHSLRHCLERRFIRIK